MRSCFHWEQSSFCWCSWAAPSAVFWRVSRCWDSKRTSRRSNACCAARAFCCLPTIPAPSARRAEPRHLAGVQGLRAAVWCWRQCSHCWKKCVNGSGGWQDERQKIPGASGRVGVSGRNAFWNGSGFRTGKPARPGIVAALPDPKCTGCSGFCPGPGVGIAEPGCRAHPCSFWSIPCTATQIFCCFCCCSQLCHFSLAMQRTVPCWTLRQPVAAGCSSGVIC